MMLDVVKLHQLSHVLVLGRVVHLVLPILLVARILKLLVLVFVEIKVFVLELNGVV